MSERARQITTRALVIAASLCIVLALVAGYVRRTVVDSDQFANRATAALHDETVSSLVVEKITDDVVLKNESDLLAARPLIESITAGLVDSRAFTGLFRSAVRDVHRAVFSRNQDTVTLAVSDVGTVLAAALEKLRPAVARKVDSTNRVELVRRDIGRASADLTDFAEDVRLLAWFLVALSLMLVAGALILSADRRRTVVELGIGAAAGGILLLLAYRILRSLAIDHAGGPAGRDAAGAVWDAFLGDLRTAAWILAGSGAVIAASAASLIKPIDIREPFSRAAGWLATEPRRPVLRVLRGVAFIGAGLLVLLEPDAVLGLALTLLGVFLIYEGMRAILQLAYRPPAPGAERERPRRRPSAPLLRRRPLVTVLMTAALIVGTVVVFVGTGGTTTAAPREGPCNRHDELCDRPLDQVVLPATHNAMSVPLPGWYSAEQDHPISDQLDAGVRGLLIDTHYADRLPNGKYRTYLGPQTKVRQLAKQDGVSPEAVDAALRIRDRLGFRGEGKRGMYLCHTFCELGATSLESVLDDIHDFLVAHPDEVLIVINQDYVTPEDFVAAVKGAGLEGLVYRGRTADPWPTLRDMIDQNQRVLFLAENHAGGASWYQPVYERITEETPYTFPKVTQLTKPSELPASCKPNRGPAEAPLFLINHWISTDPLPRPSDAEKVNADDPLLRRARECRRLRKHLPNLLAVNFYARGDLFRVVDTLNRVRSEPER
jgi:hypothetical protein